jgi:hypothetical protein
MNTVTKISIFLMFLILPFKLDASELLELKIASDKKVYSLNEDVILKYKLKNKSSKTIYYYRDGRYESGKGVEVSAANGDKLESPEGKYSDSVHVSNEVRSIKPGETFKFNVKGHISLKEYKPADAELEQNKDLKPVKGPVLTFWYPFIINPNIEEYKIKCVYKARDFFPDLEKKTDPSVNWDGEIVSNEINIKITLK